VNTANPVLDVLTATLHDAAEQLGVPSAELDVELVGSQVWRDGCLECQKPDEPICTDDTPPGYLVILTGADRRLEYHTDLHGKLRACRALRVEFERGGGFIFWPAAVTIDFGDAKALPRDDARRLQALVAMAIESGRFFNLPEELTPPGPQPYYALTIETHWQKHSVHGDPSACPSALGPLIEWLAPRAVPADGPGAPPS
jgi:hypothetical protein